MLTTVHIKYAYKKGEFGLILPMKVLLLDTTLIQLSPGESDTAVVQ